MIRQVWALPISLATTLGITVVFSSSGYLDVSVRRVCPLAGPWSPTRGVAPFGYLRIVSLCADPRSFSQLTTSFVASESLGILRMLLMTFLLPLFRGGNPNSYSLFYQYVKELSPGRTPGIVAAKAAGIVVWRITDSNR